MTKSAKLTLDGNDVEFPIHSGTLGQDVIDIKALGKTGHFTYDPGFTATASCDSKICFIDGGKGQLLYRGYTIEDLADKSNFVETVYLLLSGELPNQTELNQF
ncbi:citrate (Si)-synthase, partial [Bacillus halotolerans]